MCALLRRYKEPPVSSTYRNPILPGFFPDPSIVRVGDDYYLVNSTFHYFPAVILSHSRDLVHWQQIGHVVTDPNALDFAAVGDSCGVWAPDISFHDGLFYVYFTFVVREGRSLRCTNYVTTASTPLGPWSTPAAVIEGGIDPSHFVEDGRHYMLLNPGATLVPLSDDGLRAVGEPVLLWPGSTGRSPEGPHLLKRNGYYYLLLAEGGTGFGHRITAARSRALLGPYEPCPHNPILMQTDPEATIQKSGHGKWVQTQHGEWWIVYLCGRLNAGRFCTLGRETCLDPLEWDADGWPVINGGRGPSAEQRRPALPEHRRETPMSDTFDSPQLGPQWQFIRTPDPTLWSLSERPGYLRLRAGAPCIDRLGPANAVLQRERSHRYQAETTLEFLPGQAGEEAGLVCYYGHRHQIRLAVVRDGGRKVRLTEVRAGVSSILGERPADPEASLTLRVEVAGQRRSFHCRSGESPFEHVGEIPDCRFLSDEGVTDDFNFTGTMVGLYAQSGGASPHRPADFGSFHLAE